MTRRLAFLLSLLLFAAPAAAFNKRIDVLATPTTVTTGTPVTVVIDNDHHSSAYMYLETTNQVATASLTVEIKTDTKFGDSKLLCTFQSGLASEATRLGIIGASPATADNLGVICDMPLPGHFTVVFTVTGVGASFDVQMYLLMMGAGAGSNN